MVDKNTMKRIAIRNNRSSRTVKPRVFDAIIDENNQVVLEVKNGANKERISLADVMHQIRENS